MDRLKPKVLLALLAVLQLTALTNAQLPVDQPPDAWAAVEALLEAYGYAQSNCERAGSSRNKYTVEFDADGHTQWYKDHFFNDTTLAEGFSTQLTAPDPKNDTFSSIPTHTASLVCPYKPFPYICDLAGASVQTTATSSTTSSSWNVGITDTLKVSAGFEVLGNGNQETVTFSAGYTYSHKLDTIVAKSDTKTESVDVGYTTDPTKGTCTFIQSQMNSLTITATIQVQAVFRGYVGFQVSSASTKQPVPVYWGSDGATEALHVQHIASIVNNSRNIQCGDLFNYNTLIEVDGFTAHHDESGDYVVYSNTYRMDYFQGAQAEATPYSFNNTSVQCVNQSPPGLENVTWPTNFTNTGRRLLTQPMAKTPTQLSYTARPVSSSEISLQSTQAGQWEPSSMDDESIEQHSSSSRKLLGAEQRIRRKDTCPKVGYVTYKRAKKGKPKKAVLVTIPDPHCYGEGLKQYAKARQLATQTKKILSNLCLVSHLPSGPYNASSTGSAGGYVQELPQGTGLFLPSRFLVHQSGQQCEFSATKPLNKPWPQGVAPETLDVKIKKLVNSICNFQTRSDCKGIDYNNAYSPRTVDDKAYNATYYWSDPSIPAMTVHLGLTTPNFTNLELQTETLQAACSGVEDNGTFYCQATISDLQTHGTTTSTTTTNSLQLSAGFSSKWSVNVFGAKGSIEVGGTVTGGYSWITGESTTSTDGQSTSAFVRVPVPADSCVITKAYLNKVQGAGGIDAYACVDGLVQVLSTQDCEGGFTINGVSSSDCIKYCHNFPYVTSDPNDPTSECQCGVTPGYCWINGEGAPDGNNPDYDCSFCNGPYLSQSPPPPIRSFTMAWAVSFSLQNDIHYAGVDEWHIDDKGRACLNAPISLTYVQGAVAHVDPEVYPANSSMCQNITTQGPYKPIDTPAGLTGQHYVQEVELRPIP